MKRTDGRRLPRALGLVVLAASSACVAAAALWHLSAVRPVTTSFARIWESPGVRLAAVDEGGRLLCDRRGGAVLDGASGWDLLHPPPGRVDAANAVPLPGGGFAWLTYSTDGLPGRLWRPGSGLATFADVGESGFEAAANLRIDGGDLVWDGGFVGCGGFERESENVRYDHTRGGPIRVERLPASRNRPRPPRRDAAARYRLPKGARGRVTHTAGGTVLVKWSRDAGAGNSFLRREGFEWGVSAFRNRGGRARLVGYVAYRSTKDLVFGRVVRSNVRHGRTRVLLDPSGDRVYIDDGRDTAAFAVPR